MSRWEADLTYPEGPFPPQWTSRGPEPFTASQEDFAFAKVVPLPAPPPPPEPEQPSAEVPDEAAAEQVAEEPAEEAEAPTKRRGIFGRGGKKDKKKTKKKDQRQDDAAPVTAAQKAAEPVAVAAEVAAAGVTAGAAAAATSSSPLAEPAPVEPEPAVEPEPVATVGSAAETTEKPRKGRRFGRGKRTEPVEEPGESAPPVPEQREVAFEPTTEVPPPEPEPEPESEPTVEQATPEPVGLAPEPAEPPTPEPPAEAAAEDETGVAAEPTAEPEETPRKRRRRRGRKSTAEVVEEVVEEAAPEPGPEEPFVPSFGFIGHSEYDQKWAASAHLGSIPLVWVGLGFVAPLFVLAARGEQNQFVRRHAMAALNFQISMLLYMLLTAFLGVLESWLFVGPILLAGYSVLASVQNAKAARRSAEAAYRFSLPVL